MFEQELELEKHESSVVPLLLIVTLIVFIVGATGYYLWQNRLLPTAQEATSAVTTSLNSAGPVVTSFRTGNVKETEEVRPQGPNYRLLEKAGVLKLGKAKNYKTPVELTAKGVQLLNSIAGVQKTQQKDGTYSYVVPIADRKLAGTPKIIKTGMGHATVEFSWQWAPNELGEAFDASGPLVKSFGTWDRSSLIDKYGAHYFHGEPTRAALAMVKTDKGWQIAGE